MKELRHGVCDQVSQGIEFWGSREESWGSWDGGFKSLLGSEPGPQETQPQLDSRVPCVPHLSEGMGLPVTLETYVYFIFKCVRVCVGQSLTLVSF